MTFISYAQNYEDVMLKRALEGVRGGFYIDVGAQDPVMDSVTKAFYDQGWRGINIEPVAEWFDKLAVDRPEDINLPIAAGTGDGEITLYQIPDTGLSTAARGFAEQHVRNGREAVEIVVPTRSLDDICAAHGVSAVHFLKIDVEGSERSVLEGFSFTSIRPWIVLVEATLPNTQIAAHAEWEELLLARSYRLVYQDGLNRFYLAEEHEALAPAFDLPPNVFDKFVRYPEWRAQVELHQVTGEHKRIQATQDLIQARERSAAAEAQRDAAQALVDVLKASIAEWVAIARSQEGRLTQLESERKAGEASMAEIRATLEWVDQDRKRQLEQLESLRELPSQLAQANAELDAQRVLATQHMAQLDAMEQELESLRALPAQLEKVHQRQVEQLESECLMLGQDLRSARDAIDRDALEIERLRLESARAQALEIERSRWQSEAGALRARVAQRDCELADSQQALQRMLHSHSWRLTTPLRASRRTAARTVATLRRVAVATVRRPLALLLAWRPVRALGRRALSGRPALAIRMRRWIGLPAGDPAAAPGTPPDVQSERALTVLTPRGQAILRLLERTRDADGRQE